MRLDTEDKGDLLFLALTVIIVPLLWTLMLYLADKFTKKEPKTYQIEISASVKRHTKNKTDYELLKENKKIGYVFKEIENAVNQTTNQLTYDLNAGWRRKQQVLYKTKGTCADFSKLLIKNIENINNKPLFKLIKQNNLCDSLKPEFVVNKHHAWTEVNACGTRLYIDASQTQQNPHLAEYYLTSDYNKFIGLDSFMHIKKEKTPKYYIE